MFKTDIGKITNIIGWRRILALGVALLICAPALSAWGGKIIAFSADQVHMGPDGTVISTGKIHVAPGKTRLDGMPGSQGNQQLSVIYDKAKKRQCILNPLKKLYYEGPLDEEKLKRDLGGADMSENARVLGTETVNGFKCTKKEVETTVRVMGFTNKSKHTLWVSDRLGMPIRTRSQDGSVTELRNIKRGTPAAKYFKIPNGYTRVASMMAVMGMNLPGSSEDGGTGGGPPQGDGNTLFKMPAELKDIKLPFGKKE